MKRFLYILFVFVLFSCNQDDIKVIELSGPIFGTSYNFKYYDKLNTDYSPQIDSLFAVINSSMSNYQANSLISKINENTSNVIDYHFKKVFDASKAIYKETNGVFDPTIGSLVNYWNFGAKKNEKDLDSLKIDSLMRFVGFQNVKINLDTISKSEETYIDFNAVAKGYAVDVISEFLSSKDVNNHLVEIGGEIRVEGKNLSKDTLWRVGVQEPKFDGSMSYNKVISLQNESMATSGTYRKFKVDENGNRYAHIINTKTGYPTKTNILSVSVIAKNCMIADAYATAFQAMGINDVKLFLKDKPGIKAYLIFENHLKKIETLSINGF